MLDKYGNISAKDMDMIPITDDVDEVVQIIEDFYDKGKHAIEPNYDM